MRLVIALLLAVTAPAAADDTCSTDAAETDPGGGPGPASSPLALAMLAGALLVIGRKVDASTR